VTSKTAIKPRKPILQSADDLNRNQTGTLGFIYFVVGLFSLVGSALAAVFVVITITANNPELLALAALSILLIFMLAWYGDYLRGRRIT
jgi:hypothetical protein